MGGGGARRSWGPPDAGALRAKVFDTNAVRHAVILLYDRLNHNGLPIAVLRDPVAPTRIAALQALFSLTADPAAARAHVAKQRRDRRRADLAAGRPNARALHEQLKGLVVAHCVRALRGEREAQPSRSAASGRQPAGPQFSRLHEFMSGHGCPAEGASPVATREHYINQWVMAGALRAFLFDCGVPEHLVEFALRRSPLLHGALISQLRQSAVSHLQLAITSCGLADAQINAQTAPGASTSFSDYFFEGVARAVAKAHPGRIMVDLPLSLLSCPKPCVHGPQPQPPQLRRPTPGSPEAWFDGDMAEDEKGGA